MRSRVLSAAVIVATLVAFALQTAIVGKIGFLNGDFSAFYCAAKVAAHGADPYRLEPLRSCEVAIGSTRAFVKNPGVAIPAPLPGYAIALFVPFTVLPFVVAATLWSVILVGACIVCVLTLTQFARIPWEVSVAVLGLSLAMLSVPFGEVVPIAIACLCAAAYFSWKERPLAAALAGAGAMIEPHLGLPVCLSLAIWSKPVRLPLAVAFGALALVSLALLGWATNVEYFASVLNAHALSELNRDTQYSLTAILSALGLPASSAIRAGSLWYALMVIAGVVVANRLAQRYGNAAFLACVPPAFAVFGGTFIHLTQIAAAIPAATLLVMCHLSRGTLSGARVTLSGVRVTLSGVEGRRAALATIALLLLAVPWDWAASPSLFLAPAVLVAYVVWRLDGSLANALVAAIAAVALSFGLSEVVLHATRVIAYAPVPAIDPHLAEASWSISTQHTSTRALSTWILRLPTWLGLALLLSLLMREAITVRRGGGVPFAARQPEPSVTLSGVPCHPERSRRVTRNLTIALAAFCTLLPFAAQFYGDRHAGWLGVDVRAYYCAALAQRNGENPYLTRSVHACESSAAGPYYRAPANVAVPAPYPPYVLALMYPLTYVPFEAAALIWYCLLLAALALATLALARIAHQPPVIAWAALALSAGLTTLASGNLFPIALAALILAAYFVPERPVASAIAMACAMLEPHVALPGALALFLAFPRVRFPLIAAAVVLAALSVASAGLSQNVFYATTVLPAHALAEVSRDNQYSLSTVAAALGASDRSAVLAGTASYLIMAALGVLVALRLAQRYARPALVVLIPPAFALLGGSFVHTAEIAAAVPAALVLVSCAQMQRPWILTALVLLAVPWMMAASAAMFLAPLFPVAYLVYELANQNRRLALIAALAAFAVIFALFALAAAPTAHVTVVHAYTPIDPLLAESSWRALVLGNSTNRPGMWLLRLPTWVGLSVFAVAAAALGLRGATQKVSGSPALA